MPPRPPTRIIDLTHPVAPGMPCYPGTEAPTFEPAFTTAEHGFKELRLTLLTHTGTHVDAPAHILPEGRDLDSYPADHFVGMGRVIDATQVSGGVIPLDLLREQAGELEGIDHVLLRTGWSQRWGEASYFAGYPALSEEAARWLAGRGLRGVGIDAVSIDAAGSKPLPIHRILLGAELVIVENLTNLAALGDRTFLFCCLPLKITGADGAPVRAIALLD
jgi:arylformamidase